MTNWYEKFKNNMREAIANGWDLRAVNTANCAHEAARLGRITDTQADEIQSMYDAWAATWDEESAAPEAAEAAPVEALPLVKYNISYENNGVFQALFIKAPSADHARRYFEHRKPAAHICGIDEATRDDERPGKPCWTLEPWGTYERERAAAQEAPAAEEAPAAQQRTTYARADGEAATTSAAEALSWQRAGLDLLVCHPGKSAVYVKGAPQETKRSREDENRAHCKHIALELDAYVNGEVKRCPECGEIHRRDWDDVGDCFKCPECGSVRDVFDWEDLSVYDFLNDVFNIEYRASGRGPDDLRSVQIMVACGGPNIYLDTESGDVELYWWSERARYPMSSEARAELDAWAEEMWSCL